MNRKIKFRAFVRNYMVDVVSIDFANKYIMWDDNQYDRCLPPNKLFETESFDSIKLMQFTGLLDKNGNEIYSGDIVRCSYGAGKVIYHCGCFMVEWIDDDGADMEFLFSHNGRRKRQDGYEFEVIGNIYENPELLNK